jgi:hypothetical protein
MKAKQKLAKKPDLKFKKFKKQKARNLKSFGLLR